MIESSASINLESARLYAAKSTNRWSLGEAQCQSCWKWFGKRWSYRLGCLSRGNRPAISGWKLQNNPWPLSGSGAADPIYGTRDNRRYLKSHNIRYACKPLGRPKKQTAANKEQLQKEKKQQREEYWQRIPIEGKFGQGKNGCRLNYVRAKTAKTSEAWIRSIFLIMNLMALGKRFIFSKNWQLMRAIFSSEIFEQCALVVKHHFSSTDCAYCNLLR